MDIFIEKAYKEIEKQYISGDGGRKFINHLIYAFLPIDLWSFSINTDKKCAITRKLGYNVGKFCELTKGSLMARAKSMVGDDEEKANAAIELEAIRQSVIDYFNIEEGEDITQTRKLFYSEKSDKWLTLPALIALRDFAINKMLMGDRGVNRLIEEKKSPVGDNQPLTGNSSGFSLGDHPAFKNLKIN